MDNIKLCESEYRFATIIWANEPIASGELVKLCKETLGWKKSTTYTVLKKLCQRGILQNNDTIVTSLVKQNQVQKYESEQIIKRAFGGSLPRFIAAFLVGKKISPEEAEELKQLIDRYREE